jgi:hypothetical protein
MLAYKYDRHALLPQISATYRQVLGDVREIRDEREDREAELRER